MPKYRVHVLVDETIALEAPDQWKADDIAWEMVTTGETENDPVITVEEIKDDEAEANHDYRGAKGALPWKPGMLLPEDAIRRGRD